MPKHTLLSKPDHEEEPQQVQDYWDLVSRVAATQHPVIVRRGGTDVVDEPHHPIVAARHLIAQHTRCRRTWPHRSVRARQQLISDGTSHQWWQSGR